MTDETKKTDTADGAGEAAPKAKDELFEAIEHFKKAATILFERAQREPAVKSGVKEAGRVVDKVTEAADPMLDKVQDAARPMVDKMSEAAEPVVKQVVSELSRLTKSLLESVEKRDAKEPSDPDAK